MCHVMHSKVSGPPRALAALAVSMPGTLSDQRMHSDTVIL